MNEKNTIIQFPVLQKSCQWMYYTKYSTLVYSTYVVDQCVKIQWLKKNLKTTCLSKHLFVRIHKFSWKSAILNVKLFEKRKYISWITVSLWWILTEMLEMMLLMLIMLRILLTLVCSGSITNLPYPSSTSTSSHS